MGSTPSRWAVQVCERRHCSGSSTSMRRISPSSSPLDVNHLTIAQKLPLDEAHELPDRDGQPTAGSFRLAKAFDVGILAPPAAQSSSPAPPRGWRGARLSRRSASQSHRSSSRAHQEVPDRSGHGCEPSSVRLGSVVAVSEDLMVVRDLAEVPVWMRPKATRLPALTRFMSYG